MKVSNGKAALFVAVATPELCEKYSLEKGALVVSASVAETEKFTVASIVEYNKTFSKKDKRTCSLAVPDITGEKKTHYDELGIIRAGSNVEYGDVLIGIQKELSRSEETPVELLIRNIFGKEKADRSLKYLLKQSGTVVNRSLAGVYRYVCTIP